LIFNRFISLNPSDYGKFLLKKINDVLDIDSHYINEYEVLDYLGYKIEVVNFSEIFKSHHYIKKYGEIHRDTCAILSFKDGVILLSNELNYTRRRMTLFHEIGHDLIPWHRKYSSSYVTRTNDINIALNKKIEQQAFRAGVEIMFPLKHFLNDSQNLPIALSSIKYLANKYRASFEATCIRYALTHSNIMAVVVVIENKENTKKKRIKKEKGENRLFADLQFNKIITQKSSSPLQVQYCVSSFRFPSHISQGVEINKNNIIYDCWFNKKSIKGKIPASLLGSYKTLIYNAECFYYYNKIFVLLSYPDYQLELFKGVIL